MLDFRSTMPGFRDGVRSGLLADPGLLDEVWRLFEIEGGGELSLAAYDKYTRPDDATWKAALVQLAREGKLSRDRLLDASLDALARDFAQFRAGWFSRFHEALEPTRDERAARAARYLALLASKISPTVAFALNALKLLDKAGRLPPAAVVENISPALGARQKGTVREALRLLDRAAHAEPARKSAIARLAAEALLHEAADVQAAALDLIERHGETSDATLAELVHAQAGTVAASQRQRSQAWLGAANARPAQQTQTAETKAILAHPQARSWCSTPRRNRRCHRGAAGR